MTYSKNTNEEIAWEIVKIQKSIRRAPFLINEVIEKSKKTGWMESADAFRVFNSYGMAPKDIYLLCFSHGVYLDLEGLILSIENQREKSSHSVLCSEEK